jgi:hypothetical protein
MNKWNKWTDRATLVVATGACVGTMLFGSWLLGIGPAHADTQDQQFLNLVHSNGVGGQGDSLIAYAHEFCNTDGENMWDTALPLAGQGVWPGQFYTVRVAASRVYCPDKIAVPVIPAPVFTGLV